MSATSEFHVTRSGDDALAIRLGGVEIGRYVVLPATPEVESRKPYLHPMRTLAGDVVSAFRPWDHPWHKGLQMTWSEVSGQNFWGGKTYVDGEYCWLDNVGRMRHDGYDEIKADGGLLRVVERLSWITAAGEHWVAETRDLTFSAAHAGRGVWLLDFTTRLVNTRGEVLEFGSPTTLGRPNAGYTGLFWRGPRSWTNGQVIAANGDSEDLMGTVSPWLAISGRYDEVDGGGMVLFTAGTSSVSAAVSCPPVTWFVRTSHFAAINASPAFHQVVAVPPGESLDLHHRVAVFDRRWERAELDPFAEALVAQERAT